jgi:NAD(P) transhydrogenase
MPQAPYEFDLVCIGSGPAGQRAAIQASKLGKRVAVVEKQRCIGGVCIETGTIPSKTFREAVRRYYSSTGFEASGHFNSPGRPTMEQLVGHVGRVIEREIQIVRDSLTRNDVEMIHGRASFVDPHTLYIDSLEGARTVTSEFILISVGTNPSEPPNVQADGQTVITSDSILSLDRLPKSIAVVGAGVVGIEYASMFAALDVQVTVIDQRPRPLEFLDAEIVDELIY